MAADGLFVAGLLNYDLVWLAIALFLFVFILVYLIIKNRGAVMDAGIAVGFADALWAEMKEAAGFGKKGRKKQGS